jgi:tripartite ATP-independent transporter DctM subunit
MTLANPKLAPQGKRYSWAIRWRALLGVIPVALLFLAVIGGIYLGVFTPTEAAGIGAGGALLIATLARRMSLRILIESLVEAVTTTAMLFVVLIGAVMLNNMFIFTGVASALSSFIQGLDLAPIAIVLLILALFIVLGCFLDGMALILLGVPIFLPIVLALGLDPVWFGILMVTTVEMSFITPPVGMNLFVIKGMNPDLKMSEVYRGVLPYCVAQLVLILLIVFIPGLALWLPSVMN